MRVNPLAGLLFFQRSDAKNTDEDRSQPPACGLFFVAQKSAKYENFGCNSICIPVYTSIIFSNKTPAPGESKSFQFSKDNLSSE
jgi:hypothetical protein